MIFERRAVRPTRCRRCARPPRAIARPATSTGARHDPDRLHDVLRGQAGDERVVEEEVQKLVRRAERG